ncbi:MAG: S-methyl-5-thioribose-1-phosphate isomerase [Acidobacteriota bacterium]|nr:S-methyl-5-thioribose-1-phosphate isomerase [Acidobacteriota bacterium]
MTASPDSTPFSPIRWQDDHLFLLDQTLLPDREEWLRCDDTETVADAIRRLAVRGAPAIGVAAAYGLVVGLREGTSDEQGEALRRRFDEVAETLGGTRPTAVNLSWALKRGRKVFDAVQEKGREAMLEELLAWAQEVHAQDVETNRRIGEHGAALFAEGDRVLTHCNAGALATAGYGTAIGVINASWDAGRLGQVWVDETRPLLQGARLTAWELKRLGIPFRLVTDSSAGALMSRGLVDRIVVGADRIAANGDVANKIGTYTVAVLAHRHGVPFYVAAPLSTIDRDTASGADIPIEERQEGEITDVFGRRIAPQETPAMNFAFDVTPAELVSAIITEQGVLRAPYEASIAAAFRHAEG